MCLRVGGVHIGGEVGSQQTSNFTAPHPLPEGLLHTDYWATRLKFLIQNQEQSPRACISNTFPGDADAAGSGAAPVDGGLGLGLGV